MADPQLHSGRLVVPGGRGPSSPAGTGSTGTPGTPFEFAAGTYDLDDAVREYVRDALETVRYGETFWYSLRPTIVNGNVPAYALVMYGRAPLVGTEPIARAVLQTGFPTREEWRSIVSDLVEEIRREASARLAAPPALG
jgi:hypothetical protein